MSVQVKPSSPWSVRSARILAGRRNFPRSRTWARRKAHMKIQTQLNHRTNTCFNLKNFRKHFN